MVKNISQSKKSKNKKSENSIYILTTGARKRPTFITFNAKKAFNHLKQAFIKAPILRHFDQECHIQIEIDTSDLAIGRLLNQLSTDWVVPDELNLVKFKNLFKNSTKSDFSQWYLVGYFSRKMIPAKIGYQSHDTKLLAIFKVFKTWRHYLENCKYKILVLTNYNNLYQFMNIKILSSCQVR